MSTHSFGERRETLAAGEERDVSIYGTFLRIMAATAAFKLAFEGGQDITGDVGFYWRASAGGVFETVTLKAPADQPVTIKLVYGTGDQGNDSLQLSGYVETSERAAVGIETARIVTDDGDDSKQLVGSNPNRKSVTLFNRSDVAAVTILTAPLIGVTAEEDVPPGLFLGPRERVELSVSVPLYVSGSYRSDPAVIDVWEESYA